RDARALARLAEAGITTREADLSDASVVRALVADADLVVNAVPGFMGFSTLKTLIEAGKDVSDISFMAEDFLELDGLARQHGVTVVCDIGVAPGTDNVIFGHHDVSMKVERFECLVGGLPQRRHYPFEYKAPFSPIDVIEEYTRPARFVEGGRVVTRPALSEPEYVDFPTVGTLEAFNSDGLRSLIQTMPHVPDMKEKTLRYPGHIALMNALSAGGFFSTTPIDVRGQQVRPLDATAAILIDAWKLAPDEPELTVMRVTLEGTEGDARVRYVYDVHDVFDEATQTSSMARTTGYACTAVAELILDGTFDVKGVSAPEIVGRHPGVFDRFMAYLAERGIRYTSTRTVL
ncbi:MAG: saccharopine dehydrogenase NADP-binding domain-containing protein, partial [Myxococcales bacterium]|nr:saccharopine dehydrogenase NADP-binding domain-containing protein [Myxococcales bacterium]